MIRLSAQSAVFLTTAMLLAGCGGGANLKPVTGTITYNGSPVAEASVVFTSEGNPVASGITDASGKYTLSTNGKPGAVVGLHKVTVTKTTSTLSGMPAAPKPEDMMKAMQKQGAGTPLTKSSIPPKYGSVQGTDLSAEVTADASKNVFDFTLKD